MALGLEGGELLAAHVGAAARHHDRRIPAQQARRAAEGVQAVQLLFELLVRGDGHDLDPRGQSRRAMPDSSKPGSPADLHAEERLCF